MKVLRVDTRLPNLIQGILKLSNIVAEQQGREVLNGFKLSSYEKLKEIKSNDGTISVLEYFKNVVKKQSPDLLNLAGVRNHVINAKKVKLTQLNKNFTKIFTECKSLQSQISNVTSNNNVISNNSVNNSFL